MQQSIITTPDQLKAVISETVRKEIKKYIDYQSNQKHPQGQDKMLQLLKMALYLLGVYYHFFISK